MNCRIIFFMINVYSDDHQNALKYLKNIEVDLSNVLVITGDFNIRNNNWDLIYPHYSTFTNILMKIFHSFNLEISFSVNWVSIRYLDNLNDSNLVINLMFLQVHSKKINTHYILPHLCYSLDYTPLTVNIIIKEEFIQDK